MAIHSPSPKSNSDESVSTTMKDAPVETTTPVAPVKEDVKPENVALPEEEEEEEDKDDDSKVGDDVDVDDVASDKAVAPETVEVATPTTTVGAVSSPVATLPTSIIKENYVVDDDDEEEVTPPAEEKGGDVEKKRSSPEPKADDGTATPSPPKKAKEEEKEEEEDTDLVPVEPETGDNKTEDVGATEAMGPDATDGDAAAPYDEMAKDE